MGNVAPVIFEVIEDEDVELRMHHRLLKKHLRDISNPFDMEEELFRKHYRMVPWVAMDLIDRLIPFLPFHHNGVPPHLQVLSVLRFLSEGGYQKGLGQDYNHPMCQTTISKYLHSVIPAIIQLSNDFIKFPINQEEREVLSNSFAETLGFPGVLGILDCTLIGIHTPVEHEEAYVDHHQNHSLNVQVISDMHYNIMNIRICNGCTHDAFVWRYSEARAELITLRRDINNLEERQYYIIADSGYTQSPYILTPINNAEEGTPAYRYSQAIRRTRCRVEQLFGIWKEVLRCIHGDRTLHYEPHFAAQIIRAAAVIYNFLRHHGMPIPVPPHVPERAERVNPVFIDDDYQQGLAMRQAIIDEYFA